MEHPYYIIPTSDTTFELRFEPHFLYNLIEYSKEYGLVEMPFGTFIMEKAEAEAIENGICEVEDSKFNEEYIQVFADEIETIKGILENKFASKDEVFKAVFDVELDKLTRRIRKHMSNLGVSEEEAERIRDYFSKEITSAKTLALKKGEELIDGSAKIPEGNKRNLKNKLRTSLLKLNVDVALTNTNSQKYASMANSEGIRVSHGEDEIRMLNNGELDGFCDSEDFQIVNKSIIFHEIGHKIGDIFGNQFGESFTVKFQAECLRELGLFIDAGRFAEEEDEESETWGLSDNFTRLLFRRGVENHEKYYGLRKYYEKAKKDFSKESAGGNTSLIGNREGTENNLNEYAEVHLDQGKNLQEIFDSNIEGNHLYDGRDISVHEVLSIKYLFEDKELSLREKVKLATGFLYESETSRIINIKIKNWLVGSLNINREEYERLEQETLEGVMNEKTEAFEFAVGLLDYKEEESAFREMNTDFSRDMLRMSHLLTAEKSKEMMDRYYIAAERAVDFGARSFWFSAYLNFIHGSGTHHNLNENLLGYAKEKEGKLENHLEEIVYSLRDRKISIQGNDGSEFFIVYNDADKRYRMFESKEGRDMKLPLLIEIPRGTEKELLKEANSGGELLGREITVKIFFAGGDGEDKAIILKEIQELKSDTILELEQEIQKWISGEKSRGTAYQRREAMRILDKASELQNSFSKEKGLKERFSDMFARNEESYKRLFEVAAPDGNEDEKVEELPKKESASATKYRP